MNRCIAEALIVESTCAVKVVEVLRVSLTTEEVKISDFKVREELAISVFAGAGIEQPGYVGGWVDEVGVGCNEGAGGGKEGGKGAGVFEDGHVEAVDEGEGGEESERVVGDCAEEVDLVVVSGRCEMGLVDLHRVRLASSSRSP
jgi:hypothetical protein